MFNIKECLTTIRELLAASSVRFDLKDLQIKVISLLRYYYRYHLQDVLYQAKLLALKYPWLQNFPFEKYYNIEDHVKLMRYDEEASLEFEYKGVMQYRLVFVSIDRKQYRTLKEYPHFVTEDGVSVYYPYLRAVANIRNQLFKSLSIYTLGYFGDVPPDNSFVNAEFRTTIHKINIPVKLREYSNNNLTVEEVLSIAESKEKTKVFLSELFKRYIPKMDVAAVEKFVKNYTMQQLPKLISTIKSDYQNITGSDPKLQHLKDFPIEQFLTKETLVDKLNIDIEKTSTEVAIFNNLRHLSSPSPIFVFSDGTKLMPPDLTVSIWIKNGQITRILFTNVLSLYRGNELLKVISSNLELIPKNLSLEGV